MMELCGKIQYLPASDEPLSADVFLIEGRQCCYVYDVGSCEAALHMLQAVKKPLVVTLSHFHQDHTANLNEIPFQALYVGSLTGKKLGKGAVVRDLITIEDGVQIEIRHCPSPHANGSLILTVDQTCTLVGDLIYARPAEAERGMVMQMIRTLEALQTKYIVCSHRKGKIFEKDKLLRQLRMLYLGRDQRE